MISFSTDDLRPQDRFDHWCEVRGKNLFGVTIELERERRADFHGRFSAVTIGNATLAEMSASSYRV
ncbi:MAG: AraC family transcriptional regulator, partial [Afipia sp.]|nr:AraC family transcriptional regulator [Afipia sp.]